MSGAHEEIMSIKTLWQKAKIWFSGGKEYELPVREVTPAAPAPKGDRN
jgi:hypothetical protein